MCIGDGEKMDRDMLLAKFLSPSRGPFATIVAMAMCPILFTSMTFAADKAPITVSEAQNGDAIQLSKGRALVVRLPAQFGTGFSWAVTRMTGSALRLGGNQTESQSAGTPGASETQIFTFEATSSGTSEIEIGYRQPWMKDQPAARNFTLHVSVSSQD